jgi:hypothetical protein
MTCKWNQRLTYAFVGLLAVPLLAPINAEVVGVMKGGLGAQDAVVGSIGLIVELHGVTVDAVFDDDVGAGKSGQGLVHPAGIEVPQVGGMVALMAIYFSTWPT